MSEEAIVAAKRASEFFQKVDKSLLYHASAIRETEWLLCTRKDKVPEGTTISPVPLLSGLTAPSNDRFVIAFPHTPSSKSFQNFQQILRELVEGLYVFNQAPSISLENNIDCSSTCSLPSAYADTLLGNALLSVDYFVKSLLQGTTVAHKEKRAKLNEKWRKAPLESVQDLYIEHGMTRMEDDEELGSQLYAEPRPVYPRYPASMVDTGLVSELSPPYGTAEEQAELTRHISRDVFLRYTENVGLGLAFHQSSVQQDGDLLVFEPSSRVYTTLKADISDEKDLLTHIHTYLQRQRKFVAKNLKKKSSITYDVEMLEFISAMLLLLVTLKQQNKIINCSKLHRRMNKDMLTTDRELLPFLPSQSSRWSSFTSKNRYSSMNGEVVFHKQPVVVQELSKEFHSHKDDMISRSLAKENELVTCTINDKTYCLLTFHLEDYYPTTPKFPRWVHAMVAELRSQCAHLPLINSAKVQDYLRKPLGPRNATKFKTMIDCLVPCIENGLLAPASEILRTSTKTKITKPDKNGMAPIHYAAFNGRADVVSVLLKAGADPNQQMQVPEQPPMSTLPIHLAAKSGNLDTVGCLSKYGASLNATDENGWLPIHYAAFHNYHHIVADLIQINPGCIDAETTDSQKSTPLLLAGINGGLDTIKFLILNKASLAITDSSGRSIVHIAATKNHTNILKVFATLDSPDISVLEILTDMLTADISTGYSQAAANALDFLLRWKPDNSTALLKLNAIPKLVDLIKLDDDTLQHKAVQVLADISNKDEVKSVLVESDAIPHLIKLLSSNNSHTQSCTCLILSDLAMNLENHSLISNDAVIQVLIKLLTSPDEDVKINACACLGILATENPDNQSNIRKNDGIPLIGVMLGSPLLCIQGCAANTIKVLLECCHENQLVAIENGLIPPLISLLRSKSVSVQCSAAQAIEALADNCSEAQTLLLEDASQCKVLLRRIVKVNRDSDVKVCGATALWAVAGSLIENKRKIAAFMGIDTIVELLSIRVEKLIYVCSEALGILASELGRNQFKIADCGGVFPLTEILLIRTSQRVYISLLHTLGSLLTKPGLVPNRVLQNMVAKSHGVTLLSALMLSPMSQLVCVEAACTLGKLVLNNAATEKLLSEQKQFSNLALLRFLSSSEPKVRLLGGSALAIFVFNNSKKLQLFKSKTSIDISNFTDLLTSEDKSVQAQAAFQLVILSKLITGARDVDSSVHGIKMLVELASSSLEHTKVLCGEYLACLARCREGIPTATIMAGALDPLLENLYTSSPPIIESASAAIGFFSHNPLASRLIHSRLHMEPELYDVFVQHISHISVSKSFVENWEASQETGLPSLSLEKRGGPPVGVGWNTKQPSARPDKVSGTQALHVTGDGDSNETGLLMMRKLTLAPDI